MPPIDLTSYGIDVPATYQRMLESGLFDYGRARADWKENWKAILVQSPPALSGCDLEWLSPDELTRRATSYGGLPRWRPHWPKTFVFVAFAASGAGDEWGWAPSLRQGAAESPIVYIEHDSDEARVVAPTFQAFLFRMALSALTECGHDPKELPLRDRIAMLRKSTSRVVEYLPKELRAPLERLLSSPFRKVITRRLRERDGRFYRGAESITLSVASQQWAQDTERRVLGQDRIDLALSPEAVPIK